MASCDVARDICQALMPGEEVIALMTEYMKEYKYEQSAEAMNRTVSGGGLHSSTFRLNLSRICH